ncbi:MAG: DUF111 family protein [Planctomycetes bacterium]|nr:DUF111 family protein [Planctomycetota bacterium]
MHQPHAQVVELAVNLDDVTGEIIGAASETLLDEGALDVWTAAITMKKNRPAVMLSMLCEASRADYFARRIIELTGSFGVRHRTWDRLVLERRIETVQTDFGPIRVKVGSLEHETLVAKPEFEDVRAAAREHHVSERLVLDAARAAAAKWLAAHRGDVV